MAGIIKGARIVSMKTPTGTTPAIVYKGAQPKVGSVFKFTHKNGVTYSGTVAEAVKSDGEVLVEFKSGITPVLK